MQSPKTSIGTLTLWIDGVEQTFGVRFISGGEDGSDPSSVEYNLLLHSIFHGSGWFSIRACLKIADKVIFDGERHVFHDTMSFYNNAVTVAPVPDF